MKTFKIFSTAALALMMAACSSEDNTLETASPAMPGKLQFTATVEAPGTGATTRTEYSEQTDGTINVAWKENDKIAAIVINSEKKYVKTELTVSKVNADGSATITGDITKPKDDALTVDLIYPADIVTVAANGSKYTISFDKMRSGTLDGTLESIANNIDYRRADGCALTVSGDKATLTSAAKLESKLSIWKLTLKDFTDNNLSASKVAIVVGTDVMAFATLATAGSTAYLPMPDVSGANICIAATTSGGNYIYMKEGVTLAAKKYYQSEVKMMKGTNLALLTADYEAKDGEILTGTLASNVKISIADPVAPATTTTVTLKDVTINGTDDHNDSYRWAGITCVGSATINLEGTNMVKGFDDEYPGIFVPSGKTLTIQGTGSLTASSNGSGAGIGGGYDIACGNIAINGGTITATGGEYAAGIGGGADASCGNITITSGTITATGGDNAAGIGGGCYDICGNIRIEGGTVEATGGTSAAGIGGGYNNYTCGTITITSDVTKVTATAGTGGPNSIGKGDSGQDITVTIGGVVGAITTSPYEYPPIAATAHELSASVVGDVVGSNGKAYTLDATHVLPSGVTAVAMVASKSGSNGLAIALADEGSMNWATAKSTCKGKTAIGGKSWKLPTQDEWKQMFSANGGNDASYSGLNNALAAAGGNSSKLQESDSYWSSSEEEDPLPGDERANKVNLSDGNAGWGGEYVSENCRVRACLAF